VQPELPPTLIDERALELALINVMDNAVKYAKDGKRVDIQLATRTGRAIEIRVTDYGPGIPPEDHRRVFDRFVRGQSARDRRVRGSGIGLALVKHIAQSHGGDVWVESEEGKGCTFVITIPVRTAAPESPERATSATV
ncbi:MAG TPA: ATP-binding protein, partial [Polyangiaceae bacterium]|nr:ATP-binding protein [Polyangiaceae bacterium]